jgi:hypothetical protein
LIDFLPGHPILSRSTFVETALLMNGKTSKAKTVVIMAEYEAGG